MKKAVLTGATGFLGFVLLKELVQNDVKVYALCRKDSPRLSRIEGIGGVTVFEDDLNSVGTIDGLDDCDVFYHLAWEGQRDNFDEQYKNVDMSVNCLRLAKNLGCRRFICTGSQAEYGSVSGLITEETPLNPVNAYGSCKTAAYYLTADLAKKLGIDFTWARVFSVYGPNDAEHTLVMSLIRDLSSGRKVNLNTDGEHIWNFLYEQDAARALRLLASCAGTNAVFNVASCDSRPLKDFVKDIQAMIDPGSEVIFGTEKSKVKLDVSAGKLIQNIGEFELTSFRENLVSFLRSPEDTSQA